MIPESAEIGVQGSTQGGRMAAAPASVSPPPPGMPSENAPPSVPARRVSTPPAQVLRYTGEVVYIYAFDVAYEMLRLPLKMLLGQPVAQFAVDVSKRSPRQGFFHRAQMARLPPLERFGPFGPVRIERSVKVLPVGAISITVRMPFSVEKLEDLVNYHDLRFSNGVYLYDDVRHLAEEVKKELQPYCIRPHAHVSDEEAYTVFCFHAPLQGIEGEALDAEEWLAANRRVVASLLTEEPDPNFLSEQESEESTTRYYSYYERDVVVIDWDAALIVDEHRYLDETLYIMELANLQLAELEAYDRILDDAVEKAYRDLAGKRFGRWSGAFTQRELREIRVDMARLSDELSNITKFFGDWHLARIYQGLASRFHLGDWHRSIDEKLKTLDDMYQILQQDRNNRWMLILEAAIVLLFILDIAFLFMGRGK
jgi:hypothetical protein